MILRTSFLAMLVLWPIFSSAATIYSGRFDYRKFQSSNDYFSGRSEKEIENICKTGEHASNDDLAQCQHRDFEKASAQLGSEMKAVMARVARGDEFLSAYEEKPLATPYFSAAHDAWMTYRDNQCYSETYLMGEAAERYIYFWSCMADLTENRTNELRKIMKNWSLP